MDVTARQIGGSATAVEVCHYGGGTVKGKFKGEYAPKTDTGKMQSIARSIVS